MNEAKPPTIVPPLVPAPAVDPLAYAPPQPDGMPHLSDAVFAERMRCLRLVLAAFLRLVDTPVGVTDHARIARERLALIALTDAVHSGGAELPADGTGRRFPELPAKGG